MLDLLEKIIKHTIVTLTRCRSKINKDIEKQTSKTRSLKIAKTLQ